MGEVFKASAASTNATLDAAQAEAQGRQARNASYAEAYRLESDSNSMLETAGDNFLRMQLNKSLQLGELQAAQASQGFALTGSKRSSEISLASVIDQAIADAVKSAATQDSWARTQANLLRHEGDMQQRMSSTNSTYQKKVAQANKSAVPWLWAADSLYTTSMIFK